MTFGIPLLRLAKNLIEVRLLSYTNKYESKHHNVKFHLTACH